MYPYTTNGQPIPYLYPPGYHSYWVCSYPDRSQSFIQQTNVNWMEQLSTQYPWFRQLPINTVSMPGTHDAGMNMNDALNIPAPDFWDTKNRELFAIGVAATTATIPWSVTQNTNVAGQLRFGSRYFDFRVAPLVCNTPSGKYSVREKRLYTVHGSYGEKLLTIIQSIRDFLQTNRQEVIIMHFKDFFEMTPTSYQYFNQTMLDHLGQWMIPTSYSLNTTIGQLQDEDKRIFVIIEDDHQRYIGKKLKPFDYLDPGLYWKSKETIKSQWFDTTDINELKKMSTEQVELRQGFEKLWVLQEVLTPDFASIVATVIKNPTSITGSLRILEKDIPKELPKWLNEWTNRGWYLNTVMVDFLDDSLAKSIIDTNLPRIT